MISNGSLSETESGDRSGVKLLAVTCDISRRKDKEQTIIKKKREINEGRRRKRRERFNASFIHNFSN